MRLLAWFQIVVALMMGATWLALIVAGEVPELAAGQWDIYFHLAAEFATAVLLLTAGTLLLRRDGEQARRMSGIALGALLYTGLNSAGYFAELRDRPAVTMFALITMATVAMIIRLLRTPSAKAATQREPAPALLKAALRP